MQLVLLLSTPFVLITLQEISQAVPFGIPGGGNVGGFVILDIVSNLTGGRSWVVTRSYLGCFFSAPGCDWSGWSLP